MGGSGIGKASGHTPGGASEHARKAAEAIDAMGIGINPVAPSARSLAPRDVRLRKWADAIDRLAVSPAVEEAFGALASGDYSYDEHGTGAFDRLAQKIAAERARAERLAEALEKATEAICRATHHTDGRESARLEVALESARAAPRAHGKGAQS